MSHEKHLYLILYPNSALVASQYGPEDFSRHYQIGSTRYYSGKLIFAEIDASYRNDYFEIDKMLEDVVPHEDGTPKATKFIKSYRVLEHIDIDAIQKLYLSAPNGATLTLESGSDEDLTSQDRIRTIAEIDPLSMLVLTRMGYNAFGQTLTDPANAKGAPSIFFTSLDLDLEALMAEFESNPFMTPPLSFLHPSKLRDATLELQSRPDKPLKGVALRAPLGSISYKFIRHGFWFASQGKHLYFPMPSLQEIETRNYQFWKSM